MQIMHWPLKASTQKHCPSRPSYILFFMADPTATSSVRSMEVCSLSVGQECDSQESCANF